MLKVLIIAVVLYAFIKLASTPYMKKKRIYNGYEQYRTWWGRWKYTHRYVAEKKLGGKIWDNYVVHHRDGNKLNNRPENLQVMKKGKHSRLHYSKRKAKRES